MIVRLCSKFFKLGFISIWTKKFLRYNLDLEKAEEEEVKLPTFVGPWSEKWSRSVVSDSLWPHGLYRLFSPWDFPGKNTGVGCHFLLQGIFLTQGLNPGLPHSRQMLYHLSHPGSQESWSKQGNYRKTSTSASLTMLIAMTEWITTNCGKYLKC